MVAIGVAHFDLAELPAVALAEHFDETVLSAVELVVTDAEYFGSTDETDLYSPVVALVETSSVQASLILVFSVQACVILASFAWTASHLTSSDETQSSSLLTFDDRLNAVSVTESH